MALNVALILWVSFVVAQTNAGRPGPLNGRETRAMGFTLNDWCDSWGGFECKMAGAACVADSVTAPGFDKVCKCIPKHEPYISVGSLEPDRCAALPLTLLIDAECDINDDCLKNLPNTVCPPPVGAALHSKCICRPGFIQIQGGSGCRPFDCNQDGGTAACSSSILKDSVCQPSGQCTCPAGQVANNKSPLRECINPATFACASDAECPTLTSGVLKCDGNPKRCTCPVINNVITSLTVANGVPECKPLNLGSTCYKVQGDCPNNLVCVKNPTASGPNDKGICACGPLHKQHPTLRDRCVHALGSCCRSSGDCGLPPAPPAIGLTCARFGTPNFDMRSVCTCVAGNVWDAVTSSCKPAPPNTCL